LEKDHTFEDATTREKVVTTPQMAGSPGHYCITAKSWV